jgi:sugar phosphate isomerase/epimerase
MTSRYPGVAASISVNGVYDSDAPLADDIALCEEVGTGWLGIPNWKIGRIGLPEASRLIRSSAIRVSTICHPNVFTLDDSTLWPAELVAAKASVDAAATLGAPSVYLTTGNRGGLDWAAAAEAFVAAIPQLRDHAKVQNISLLVEPTPTFSAISIIHTMHDLVLVAERAQIGTCIDGFSCWADSSFLPFLPKAASLCGLVQVSDHVNGDRHSRERAVPGDGVVDWTSIFQELAKADYKGLFDIEMMGPRITAEGTVRAFRRGAGWLTDQLRQHGLSA